jgi:hypothetical protein
MDQCRVQFRPIILPKRYILRRKWRWGRPEERIFGAPSTKMCTLFSSKSKTEWRATPAKIFSKINQMGPIHRLRDRREFRADTSRIFRPAGDLIRPNIHQRYSRGLAPRTRVIIRHPRDLTLSKFNRWGTLNRWVTCQDKWTTNSKIQSTRRSI